MIISLFFSNKFSKLLSFSPLTIRTDRSRIASSQYNNSYHKKYFCQHCLQGCINEEVLKNHLERCKLHGTQGIKLPQAEDKDGSDKVKFKKRHANYV